MWLARHTPAKLAQSGESRLERRGGKYHGRVRYRLLPQLVGDPGGLQGMGCRRDQLPHFLSQQLHLRTMIPINLIGQCVLRAGRHKKENPAQSDARRL